MRTGCLCVALLGLCAMVSAHALDGSIRAGVYHGPGGSFRVDVPEMRNPFIKQPAVIRDARHADGGSEVNFSVPDLGEAWRYGVRPLGAQKAGQDEAGLLARVADAELQRWSPSGQTGELMLEDPTEHAGRPALIRVHHVPGASLLFGSRGGSAPQRESALVGVLVFLAPQGSVALYAIGQFDMPNRGGHYTLDTDRGRRKLAEQHLKRLREMSASLRLN